MISRRCCRQSVASLLFALSSIAALAMARPGLALAEKPSPSAGPVVFETHVRPIFKAHCFQCHGEAKDLKGGLDLRLARFVIKGGESGPAIVPSDKKLSFLSSRFPATRCRRATRS